MFCKLPGYERIECNGCMLCYALEEKEMEEMKDE